MKNSIHLIVLFAFSLSFNSLFAQNALHFDGVDDKVDCGTNSTIEITSNTITMEAWIKADVWENNVWEGNIINKEQNAGTSAGYMLRVGEGGKLNMNLGNGNWNELTTQNSVLSLNTWHHIAGTYDGSKMRLYVDGVAVDSANYSVTISNSTAHLTIGSHPIWNSFFEGSIDEVRIWDIARTQAEIQQNMNTLQCADAPGLKAYYRFDQGVAGGNNSSVTTLDDGLGISNGTLQTFALSGSTSNWVSSSPQFSAQYQNYSQTDTICDGEVLAFGSQMLSAAGVFTDTIPSQLSCDSVITLTLSLKTINSNISFVNDTLWAQDPNLSYHWVDCNNLFRTIPGATNQYYAPTINTSYAVIVTDGECIDTSACINVNIGLDENRAEIIETYPNPIQNELIINAQGLGTIKSLEIISTDGKRLVSLTNLSDEKIRINTESLPKGVYQLQMFNDHSKRYISKIIKL